MNTYTDARLLGTAEAVETLPSFNAPTVAPTLGQEGLLESLSGNLGEITGDQDSHEKTSQTKGITTFDEVGLTRFELAISTPPVETTLRVIHGNGAKALEFHPHNTHCSHTDVGV